jgi:hypothetical protein
MDIEVEYSDFLPLKFKTWTDFYRVLREAGQVEHETVHYRREVSIGGLQAIGASQAFEDEHYKMGFVREKMLEEQKEK